MDQKQEQDQVPEAPVDKKRIALLNGACGTAGRILVTGQVVDVPVTSAQIDEVWDPYLNLPMSLMTRIRPIQDFGMTAVRRPRMHAEILEGVVGPGDDRPPVHTGEIFTADDASFFQRKLELLVPPGEYTVRLVLRGIDSMRQSVSDLQFIGNAKSLILRNDIPIGHGHVLILPDTYTGPIVTSDIDQTFLDTQIGSNQGLMETMFETPDLKKPLPGMEEFYRLIHHPLFFISASPHFFRRTLGAVFAMHNIPSRGLYLKYLVGTIETMLRKSISSLLNLDELLSGGFGSALERSLKFLGSSVQSLFDQVSYKLTTLLENRLMHPTGAQEILIGDNTESDYFIFTLYQFLLSGKCSGSVLENYLYRLNFHNREALTRDAARRVRQLVEANLAIHGLVNPVTHVWINTAKTHPDHGEMIDLVDKALPAGLFTDTPGIIAPRACDGALAIGIEAFNAGLIDMHGLKRVWKSMNGQSFRDGKIDGDHLRRIAGTTSLSTMSVDELIGALSA